MRKVVAAELGFRLTGNVFEQRTVVGVDADSHGGRVDGVALLLQRFAVEAAVIVHGNTAGAAVEPADVRRGLERDDIARGIAVDVHAVRQPRKLPVCRFFLPSGGTNARNAQAGASQRMPRFSLAFFSFPSGAAACPRADTP